jgi:hypothetical protein
MPPYTLEHDSIFTHVKSSTSKCEVPQLEHLSIKELLPLYSITQFLATDMAGASVSHSFQVAAAEGTPGMTVPSIH